MAIAGMASLISGDTGESGRLALSVGTFADPNTYCLYLWMGLPFLWLKMRTTEHVFQKALPLACTIPVLGAGLATGSRSGLIALVAIFGLLFLRVSMARKLQLALLTLLGVMLAGVFLSNYVLARYKTFFVADASAAQEHARIGGADAQSVQARSHLFRRSIELTIMNPLLGVGPGMFAVAEADVAKEQGQRGAWHQTHNTYTQVSSETGIPGLLLYGAALFFAWRSVTDLYKAACRLGPKWQNLQYAALYLGLALTAILVGVCFLSLAYTGLLFILAGLATALQLSAAHEMRENVPVPAVVPARPDLKRPLPAALRRPRR
jgi:O-antigen ligase